MKRLIPLILVFALQTAGCSLLEERILEPVTYYYLSTEYTYGKNSSVIISEQREASGHRDDLSYLLALYLMGPVEEGHRSPLPPGTRILKPEQQGSKVTLELVNTTYPFTDTELTLACACLTLTCLDITDAAEVTITYNDRTTTMTKNSLTLLDNSKGDTTTEETQ